MDGDKRKKGGINPFEKAFAGGLPGILKSQLSLPGFKKGGRVKKTGAYMLHQGEQVISAKKAARYRKHPWKS